jgi:predicted dehydrogenase
MSGAVLIGILGCGRAAERLHLPALQRIGEARLTAAYDPLPERRDLIARAAPGCRPFASAEALLAARVVDAVIVAAPPEAHAELAELALRARLPVLIEKPLATSLEEAIRVAEVERVVRQAVMVGFNRRWWEPAQALHHALAQGGDVPPTAESRILSDLATWGAVAAPANPLEDLAVHHLHLLPYLLDQDIATVRAYRVGPQEIELLLAFRGGSRARCIAGFGPRSEERVEVDAGGRRYAIEAGSERISPAGGAVRAIIDVADAVRRRLAGGRGSLKRSYERQLRAFLDCIQAGRAALPASPGTADGIAAMLAIEAARTSLARNGAEIPVPSVPTS